VDPSDKSDAARRIPTIFPGSKVVFYRIAGGVAAVPQRCRRAIAAQPQSHCKMANPFRFNYNMPLLTELKIPFCLWFYKYAAPNGALWLLSLPGQGSAPPFFEAYKLCQC
jgi:hypothetical protein